MKGWFVCASMLLWATTARANLDETLDISAHVSHAAEATGIQERIGLTLGDVRFGGGFGVATGRRFTGEAFAAYAPNGYWSIRPSLELRAHVDRVATGDDVSILTGIGPRLGVLVPIDEYFFVDLGLSRDLIGPENYRGTIGIGLPIPLSHL